MRVEQQFMNYNYIPEIKSKEEQRYIRKRKRMAFFNSLCFYICRIFPIDNKLLSVCTFEGRGGFGCNPKYIIQELHNRKPDCKIIWFVNDMNKEFPDYIHKVPNTLWSRAYWLSRSKVWIDNYRKPYGTVKRKRQYYVNTWHANMGFKNIGLWRKEAFSTMAYLVSKNDSDMIDDIVVDSKCIAEYFRKGLIYNGTYIMSGQPRCDILYNDRTGVKNSYRRKYNIPLDAKIVMFAPTFREGAKDGRRYVFSKTWTIDFKKMIDNLGKKFGGQWYLCVRVHPQLADAVDEYSETGLEGRIINASKEDDMYEILAAMDAYVTDYSSAAFDAMCGRIPVFIYADDIEQYTHDRGSLIWNLSSDTDSEVYMNHNVTKYNAELPFSIAKNNDELEKNILLFNKEVYGKLVENMENSLEYVKGGRASEKVVAAVINKMNE